MGIDVIKLRRNDAPTVENRLRLEDLSTPQFQLHQVPQSKMAIWLMNTTPKGKLFPWWEYDPSIDEDFQALNQMYSIRSPQGLFDSLVLSQIKKMAGPDLFAIFPGKIKTEGWGGLQDIDKETFERGDECIYHLEAEFKEKLSINWVPYYKPQSLVKNPSFGSLWRLFNAGKNDDYCNSLCMFSLRDRRQLPKVLEILIKQSEHRSEELLPLVDWFGVYSSPISPNFGVSLPIYTDKKEILFELASLKNNISTLAQKIQADLVADPNPSSVIRSLSRNIAL